MKQSISILGSTGSIGLSVLSIIDKRKNLFKQNYLQQIKVSQKYVHKLKDIIKNTF